MIARLPRVVYRDLPEGQDWTITEAGGKQLIVINAALDEPGRKRARWAAYGEVRRSYGSAAGLLLLITGAAAWAGEQVRGWVRTPIGSAVIASGITATTIYYGVVHVPRDEPPTTSPPVVTIQESPTPAKPTPSARATRQSPKPRDDPGSGGEKPRPRQTAPPQAEPTPTAKPTRTTPPAPPPTSRAEVEDVAEEESAASSPPAAVSEPSPTETETTEPDAPRATSEPPPQATVTAAACDGVGLDVDLGDLPVIDACLLG